MVAPQQVHRRHIEQGVAARPEPTEDLGRGGSRVLRDMAAQNFGVNLEILSDLINELYLKTTNIDRASHEKKRPVYERIPELKDLGRLLVKE